MGGAVSSGRDNSELIDNLMGGNYIRTRDVERVFRALDRGDYMTPEARDQAYKDLAWRNGPLHMSAPCIYSEVMEGLDLKPGLSFLNIGSGTGYLSTLVGMILGSSGINHGIDVHPLVVEYANKKLSQFLESSPTLDEFDFCEPKFMCGNGLCLAPSTMPYDRVYCGAGCPDEYQIYFQHLIKEGGVLIMPLNDNLLQVKRVGPERWVSRSLLSVTFASLRVPGREEALEPIRMEDQTPTSLQQLARGVIRGCMRGAMRRRHPQVREPPPRAPPAKRACPRRICIPVDDDSDTEGLNGLHDLDRASGAHEMNALLSLVLSMGHNRVAGALRVDPLDSDSSSEQDHDQPQVRILNVNDLARNGSDTEAIEPNGRPNRNLLMFEFRDRNGAPRHNAPARRARRRRRPDSDVSDDRLRDSDVSDHLRRDSDVSDHRHRDSDVSDHRRRDSDVSDHRYRDSDVSDHQRRDSDVSDHRRRDIGYRRRDSDHRRRDSDISDHRRRDSDFSDVSDHRDNSGDDARDRDASFDHGDNNLVNNEATEDKQGAVQDKDDNLEDREHPADTEDTLKDKKALENKETTLKGKEDTLKDEEDTLKDNEDKLEDKEVKLDKKAAVTEIKRPTGEGTSKDTAPREVKFEKKVIKSILKNKESSSTSYEKDSSNSDFASQGESTWANLNHKEFKSRNKSSKSKKAPSRRSNRSSRRTSNEEQKKKEVPAEVEICLGKSEMAGPSTMEWEAMDITEAKQSSEDETTETSEVSKLKEEKRQKLDSGIGEENSPSVGSASHKSGESEEESQPDSESDEGCDEDVKGRRRRQKRGHLSTRSSSSTDEAGSDSRMRGSGGRRSRPRRDHDSARRAQLSTLMKRAVKELPLPHALQKYVNLGRCFEF